MSIKDKKKRACPLKPWRRRVICAMSGGVDSSVAAALLLRQGYEVIGVFMKLWAEKVDRTDLVRENICCSVEAATAARTVAGHFKIPFYVINLEKEFKEAVVDYYIKEYENGRTPNPCVICNRDIKGEILFKKAIDLGADYLATGHYARLKAGNSKFEIRNSKHKEYYLLQAKDKIKDQTYFLWTLTQKHLAKILFPIGDYTKAEVRKMAKKWHLPTAERRESQGICFIPDRNVCGFLRRHAKKMLEPGDILDTSGKKLGIHNGLINYTVGQRERLGLGGPRAYFVVKLDSRENTLIVGDEKDLYFSKLTASSLNWINSVDKKLLEKNCSAKIRYGHPADPCRVNLKSDKLLCGLPQSIPKGQVCFQTGFHPRGKPQGIQPVENKTYISFGKPQRAITPGQSIVFYLGEKVLGGGIIN